jgi:hypothetical protein
MVSRLGSTHFRSTALAVLSSDPFSDGIIHVIPRNVHSEISASGGLNTVQPAHQLNLLSEAPHLEIDTKKAREDCIDPFVMWMEDNHPVDIAEKLKRPPVQTDFSKTSNAPKRYDQLVAWITWQYDLATYWRAVDSCLASTTSTQGDSPLSRLALSDSPLDELSWDDYRTFAEIKGCLMVTFVTINKTVMVDDTDNKIKYIKTNPLNLEWTSTIRVKQEDEHSGP